MAKVGGELNIYPNHSCTHHDALLKLGIMKKTLFLSLIATCALCTFNTSRAEAPESIRIQLKPAEETKINAAMTGVITKLHHKDGEHVEKNTTLISFECNKQKAQYAQAQARVKRQSSLLQSSERLFKLGSASKTDLGVLKAELAEAKASRDLANAQIKDCTVKAPFSGIISAQHVKSHYSTQIGDPMIELVGDGALEIEMIIPSKWMQWLKKDTLFDISVDDTGGTYEAKVTRFSGRVDPVTQSVKAYAVLEQKKTDLLPGMSGQAFFSQLTSESGLKEANILPSSGP